MSRALLAAFARPEPLIAIARSAADRGERALEAFTPYPVEGLSEALGQGPTRIPWYMLAGGLAMAALAYATEWWSATYGYPFDQGGRPLNSWAAFMLAPVEVGVLVAGLTGFVAFLLKARLPRLHHPLFDHTAFERASQDQFMLALALPDAADAAGAVRQSLFEAGAVWIEEVEL